MPHREPWLARLVLWWFRLRCVHHWHAADAMIALVCCWCSHETDGAPDGPAEVCAYEWTRTGGGWRPR